MNYLLSFAGLSLAPPQSEADSTQSNPTAVPPKPPPPRALVAYVRATSLDAIQSHSGPKAVIYSRISNGPSEASIEKQETNCLVHARLHWPNHTHFVLSDGVVSARATGGRTRQVGLVQVCSSLNSGDVLLVNDVSRFSRSVVLGESLATDLGSRGVVIAAVMEGITRWPPGTKVVSAREVTNEKNRFQNSLAAAERESDTISVRVREGLGFRRDVIKAKVAKLMIQVKSYDEVATILNRDMKVFPPSGRKTWTPVTVAKILKD